MTRPAVCVMISPGPSRARGGSGRIAAIARQQFCALRDRYPPLAPCLLGCDPEQAEGQDHAAPRCAGREEELEGIVGGLSPDDNGDRRSKRGNYKAEVDP